MSIRRVKNNVDGETVFVYTRLDKTLCEFCGRWIGTTSLGIFRRHVSAQGIVCRGAWMLPRNATAEAKFMGVDSGPPDKAPPPYYG